jgi:acyl carrier protein
MSQSVEQKVKEILVNELGVGDEEVTPTANLFADLGADSLDAVTITMALEEDFDIQIPDEDAEKWRTVADIVAYVEKRRAV